MKQEANCPKCDGPITVWQMMKAPTPFNIRCPDCGVRIHVEGWNRRLTVATILSGWIMAALLIYLFITTSMALPIIAGIVVAFVLLAEILLILLLINKGIFIIPRRRASDRTGEPREPKGQEAPVS